jgi:hypothetical protein
MAMTLIPEKQTLSVGLGPKSGMERLPPASNLRGGLLVNHWPLVATLAIFGFLIARLFLLCTRAEDGHYSYVCDDIYIHMAVAKNFVLHGVWGVTPYSFSSSTSSIIWPLLLAAIDDILGPSEMAPFLLNLIFAVLAIFLAYAILRRLRVGPGQTFFALLAIVFFAPLPWLVFSGMEHSLQIASAIPFIYLAAEEVAKGDRAPKTKTSIWLWILAPVLTLTRYEGLFLVFAACLLFLIAKRWGLAFGLGALAVVPVAAYGLVSAWKGWFWLPNSVVLKAGVPKALTARGFIQALGHGNFAWTGRTVPVLALMAGLLVLLCLIAYRQRRMWPTSAIMLTLVIITACLHLQFARLGFFFRYEAYLVALGLFVLAAGASEYFRGTSPGRRGMIETPVAALWIAYMFFVPFAVLCLRGFDGLRRIPQAAMNNYEQQRQMGAFLAEFYRGQSVALNDIGATSYYGEPRTVDLWGLGTLDVAREMTRGFLSPQQIAHLATAHNAKIAILHEAAFKNGIIAYEGLPPEWRQVGRWTIPNNYICANSTVSFFAVDPSEEVRLIASLREFSSQLPRDVRQDGLYTEAHHGALLFPGGPGERALRPSFAP